MTEAVNILIVDAHELVRQGLRRMLEAEEDIKVVGECASAEEALAEMPRLSHDIVLLGTHMTRMNLIEAIHKFKMSKMNSNNDVIVLDERTDKQAETLQAGAASYLLSDITHIELAQAIRKVYRNKRSPSESTGLIREIVELVVPSPVNATQLLKFMCPLGEMFHDDFASIICTVGSWNHSSVITLEVQPTMLASFLTQLADIPNVENIEEEPMPKGSFSTIPKKLRFRPRSSVNPSKRFRVTLKEDVIAGQ